MSLTSDEITAAIAELMALKPRPKSAVASAALTAAGLSPELREHRKALRNRVTAARSKLLGLQKEVTELLEVRGYDHWCADNWKRTSGHPLTVNWFWYGCSGRYSDTKLQDLRIYLTSATANLQSASTTLQLFDACHDVQGIDYAEPPPPIDQEAIEAAAYEAAPPKHAAAIDRVKAALYPRHRPQLLPQHQSNT